MLLQSVRAPAGKTTLLRDIIRTLADDHDKLVMVVDTSQEIAGGGLRPHACIGSARRILGGPQQSKHEVLQEAVANHGPEVKPATVNLSCGRYCVQQACTQLAGQC